MDAKDHSVISVLGDQRRFMVPIYQRQYSWREGRLVPFWEDVVAKAEETLSGKPRFKHYMGALIIAPGADGYKVGATPRIQVVDGQQRLTTFQLFLAAMREVANRHQMPGVAESVQNYVFNRPMSGDTDPDAKFKLVPTPEDRPIFHAIIDGSLDGVRAAYPQFFYKKGTLIWGEAPNALRAFVTFIERIESYTLYGLFDPDTQAPQEDGRDQQADRLNALLEALLNHLKLVVITLDESDDAQVIFETLNSKAEPLLAMDLVRNNIFHRAEAQGESADKLFESKWKSFDAPFWKAPSPRAKPPRPRIDHFLSHALTAQTGEEASLRELYAEYRAFTRPKGQPRFPSVADELDALLRFAPVYSELELPQGTGALSGLGGKLATWEISTAYPLVFAIATAQEVADEEKAALYRLIYSYIVRRAVCGLTPKAMNKTFQRIVGVFLKHGVSRNAFAASFADQTGPAVRFPSDQEFRAAIHQNPVYEWVLRKERLIDVLWELELASRTKFMAGSERPEFLSVEHVLPQAWMTHWPLPDGRMAPLDKMTGADESMLQAIATRDRLKHTLGNLTLSTRPGNSVMSNGDFAAKKPLLAESLLALNNQISKEAVWGEPQISARADALAGLAVAVWPGPDLPASPAAAHSAEAASA
ncbi:uncharacterized protein DUF1524 [Azospirillum brasilense]|uniref:Uncharacterized protein DUF1524 n=1 Tax=Azospirillum brasilense TaxID=192 RepID=A0A560CJW7_AZOBR|nr:DUF262 domain-containing protein [Azospirillum brasilense]TWA85158.1 uncharacterized protein DUF1524 [Azospirillum brasilense]